MTWTRLDDGIFDHPKMLRAGDDAAHLYVRALVYCNRLLTDGRVHPESLPVIFRHRAVRDLAARLVSVGAWDVHPEGGWMVHDFHDLNPTADEVRAKRDDIRTKRSAAGKQGGIASGKARSNEANPKQPPSKDEAPPKQPNEADTKPRPVPSRPSVEDAYASSVGDDAIASPADPSADDRAAAVEAMIRTSSALSRGVADARAEAAVIVSRYGDRADLLDLVARARDYLAGTPKRLPSNGAQFLLAFIAKATKPSADRSDAAPPAEGSPAARIVAALAASPRLSEILSRPNEFAAAAVKAYPAVDVPAEIARAAAWLVENPANAKSNGARYLGNWLRRAQERAPRVESSAHAPAPTRVPAPVHDRPSGPVVPLSQLALYRDALKGARPEVPA